MAAGCFSGQAIAMKIVIILGRLLLQHSAIPCQENVRLLMTKNSLYLN